jgi:hypothetical protein
MRARAGTGTFLDKTITPLPMPVQSKIIAEAPLRLVHRGAHNGR